MKKREFLRALGLGALGFASGSVISSQKYLLARAGGHARKYWAWMTTDAGASPEELKKRFAVIRGAGIEAILPEIYDSRHAYYASKRLPVEEPWLETILPLAKSEGLEVHGWIWSMPCNIEEVRRDHPEWFAVNRRGESAAEKPAYVGYYKFLCPSHIEVQEFLKANVAELCGYETLDGIHLDYIRYPDVILPAAIQPRYGLTQDRQYPEFDYCYCSLCRDKFKEQTGIDPLDLDDPSENAEWRQFRCDRITHLVNDILIPVARAHKKYISAAVFPEWQLVRQEWPRWNLDAVLPMLYHTLYKKDPEWIREETEKGIRAMSGRMPLYSGLMVHRVSSEELGRAIGAALDGGANGVTLFDAQAMTEAHWQVFRKAVGS
jgi:uncharacterized lipoprotein YddW (UPF0748 family)